MIVFDQLKRDDPQLRLLTIVVLAGVVVLLAGLWWVQIVSARDYQANLETQSFRTVRIPAVRGKILDRNGVTLAENRPVYNVSLYLEELRDDFQKTYAQSRPTKVITNHAAFWKRWLGASNVQTQLVKLNRSQITALTWQAREQVASNVTQQISVRLQRPLPFDVTDFRRHYTNRLALPYPIAKKIDASQIARFEEQSANAQGVDLEIQSDRFYPNGTTAAHLLGHLSRDDSSIEGEEAFFNYRLPDYRGVLGIEGGYDLSLHGHAGAKSVLVNNLGYRQTENIWTPAEPGSNVVLTIDLPVQKAAEEALLVFGPETRGAAVVMDVHTGYVLAMVSAPTYNPNSFIPKISVAENERLTDPKLLPQINRATQGSYPPGSIFKVVVGLAALENGLNPNQKFNIAADPANPARGISYANGHPVHDTARPGEHDFRSALKLSSNSYFIMQGLHAGIEKIVELGQRLHLGERTGLRTRQEVAGTFPSLKRVRSGWYDGNTANVCIGQDPIKVTPLQMTVIAAAIANGGKVLSPRLVDRIEPQDPISPEQAVVVPPSHVPDDLGVKPENLKTLREAMLLDTEEPGATAYPAFAGNARGAQLLKSMRVCGKTGTGQIKDEHGQTVEHITWFLSFAPYDHPRYAVVVMIEGGSSGGGTCAPVAERIYETILERERANALKSGAIAKAN
jgi:penicillin-binding protein 2